MIDDMSERTAFAVLLLLAITMVSIAAPTVIGVLRHLQALNVI